MGKVSRTIWLFRKLVHFFFRPEIIGFDENIPKKGGAIIAANHGGFELDTYILSCITRRWIHVLYWDYFYYDNISYYLVKYVKPIPVNIPHFKIAPGLNINNPKHIVIMKKFFRKGHLVGIFPDGDSNTMWEGYRLHKFYPGVSKLAIGCEVPVIPTAIIGVNEGAPLLFEVKNKGTPSLLALPLPILLPKKVIIHFGAPMYFDKFYNKEVSKAQHWKNAELIRQKVAALLKEHGKDLGL